MEYRGYMGKILFVDLTTGAARTEALNEEFARAFSGGMGFTAKLAYDLIPRGIDPLSADNVIVVAAGPLTGTMAPGSSRVAVTTKFPLSSTIGGGNGGVRMGAQIKRAGYDALVITGKAPRPIYLRVADSAVTLEPAQQLWGKDIYETTERLWAQHGAESGVLAIGQAGENQVKVALAMMDKIAATGRGGLAAVMGSKNLKAIAVDGSQDVTVADAKRFMKLVNRYFERIKNYELYPEWISIGMQRTWADTASRPGFGRAHGTELVGTAHADRLCGVEAYRAHRKANFACVACPLSDKEISKSIDSEGKELITFTSSFSAKLEPFVTCFNLATTDEALQVINTTNRYGLDNHDLIGIMDQVVHLYEQGVIGGAETGGVPLKRDFGTAMRLIQLTGERQGLGAVMAEGMDGVCRAFGQDPAQHSLAIKGWRSYMDPRVTGLGTMEFEMVVNPRGGHHTSGGSPAYSSGSATDKFARHANRMGAPDDAIARVVDPALGFHAGRFTRYSEDWYAALSALGMCVRLQLNRFHSIGSLAELYSAATGIELSPEALAQVGERTWNVVRAFAAREGRSRKDDRFPELWFEPVKAPDGRELGLRHYFGQPIDRQGAEQVLDDYYDERGWSKTSGIPTKEKLGTLGLQDVADDLRRQGVALD